MPELLLPHSQKKIGKRFHRLPGFIPEWIRRRVEVNVYELYRFMKQAGKSTPPNAMVLDAGAGEGRFKAEFSHTRYYSVDITIGDTQWDYSDLDTISDLVALPFKENSFDVALCNQVLEHVPEPASVLQEIYRVLKPGGRLYLSIPQSWAQHQKPHDYFRYTSFGITYLLKKAGFELEKIQNLGGYFWYLSFQLQNINFWLFSQGRLKHKVFLPLRMVFWFVFELILPLILFYLDPLDKLKDETFGYACIAVKSLPRLP